LRFPHGESVAIGDFENFKSGYAASGQHYMVGQVDFAKLKEWSQNEKIGIILSPGSTFLSRQASKISEMKYSAAYFLQATLR